MWTATLKHYLKLFIRYVTSFPIHEQPIYTISKMSAVFCFVSCTLDGAHLNLQLTTFTLTENKSLKISLSVYG